MKRSSRTIQAATALACALAAPIAPAADLLVCSTTVQVNFAALKKPDTKFGCYEPANGNATTPTLRELHEQGWRPTVASSVMSSDIHIQFMSFWERPGAAPASAH